MLKAVENNNNNRKKLWTKLAVGFAVWTIIGLSFGTRSYLQAQFNGSPVTVRESVVSYLVDFYYWAAVSPLIFLVCRRYPIEFGIILRRLVLYVGLGIIIISILTAATIPTAWYLGLINKSTYPTLAETFSRWMVSPFLLHQGLLAYWGTVAAAHAYNYYEQVQSAKLRASDLSAQLAKAQLAALQMQVNPHFLFNTLNSISALIHKDAETADRMIARLSDFLRATLKGSDETVVTLAEELEFLKTYLEIEKVRFQDRLTVLVNVDDSAANAIVPRLILQPLVENSIRHGVGRLTGDGKLTISAVKNAEKLSITIDDNGPGLDENRMQTTSGIGLSNIRDRLAKFYDSFSFEIANRPAEQGVTVNISVPFLTSNK